MKDIHDYRKMWKAAGGDTFGPRVEHWSIEESKVMGFIDAVVADASARAQEDLIADLPQPVEVDG